MGVGAPFRFWATNLTIRAGIAFFATSSSA
jgi:hypothetical protein